MKKILASVVVMAASLAVFAPAQAAESFTFDGTAVLPAFPCPAGCTGTFTGTASGDVSGPITQTTFTYNEPNCSSGNASGQGKINGVTFTFSWVRVGATALLNVDYQGNSYTTVAAFTTEDVGSCVTPGPITAHVQGAGARA